MARAMAERLRYVSSFQRKPSWRTVTSCVRPCHSRISRVPGLNFRRLPMLAMRPVTFSSAPRRCTAGACRDASRQTPFRELRTPARGPAMGTLGRVITPKSVPAPLQGVMIEIVETGDELLDVHLICFKRRRLVDALPRHGVRYYEARPITSLCLDFEARSRLCRCLEFGSQSWSGRSQEKQASLLPQP
jgi:hypothetical protein